MNRLSILSMIAAPFALALLTGCDRGETLAVEEGTVLARVGERVITDEDLRVEAGWRRDNNQFVPPPAELLEEMVERAAMIERARRDGLHEDPEVRRRMESQLIHGLRRQTVEPALNAIEIPDEELRATYEDRIEDFTRKGMDRFAILFVAAHEKSSATKRAEARERLEQALAGHTAQPAPGGRGPAAGGFGQIAVEISEDQASRYRGGDIGWIGDDVEDTRFPEAVLAAGRGLEVGSPSDVIETAEGYYAILKTDARQGGARPFEEVAAELRTSLLRERRREFEKDFVAEAIEQAGVEMNAEAAADIELPSGGSQVHHDRRPPAFPADPGPSPSSR